MQYVRMSLKVFLVFFYMLSFSYAGNTGRNASMKKLNDDILMAENYLWLTMDEGSFTKVDKKTLKYIDISDRILKQITIPDKELYEYKIQSLKDQLFALRAVEGKSLYGYFPLLKYAVSDFFFMPSDPKIHTLVKNPKYLGVHNAVKASTNILRQLHQRHVFINSIPYDPEAEEIAFNIFNGTDKLFSRLDKEVVTALGTKANIQHYRDNNITQNVVDKLCDYVGDESIYLVTVIRNLTEEREYYYTISTSNYGYKGKNDLMSTDAFGYAIDESPNWPIIIFVHLALLLLIILFSLYKAKKISWQESMLPLIFFIVGRVSPWIIIPVLLTFKPAGEAHALYSFWWVLLLGIAIFIVPIILVKLFYKKVLEYVPLPNISGKGDIIGLSAAAGAIAFLIIPFLYAFDSIETISDISAFVLFSAAILLSGYIMGKALDDNDKMDEKNLIYFVGTSSILIVAFMHGISLYLIVASLVTIIIGVFILIRYQKSREIELLEKNKLSVDNSVMDEGECESIDSIDLKDRIQNPPYQRFDYFKNILEVAKDVNESKVTRVALKGDAGSGKTATAKVLIDLVGNEITNNGETVLLLSSTCKKHDGDEVAYQMFYKLLDSTLNVDLFGQRQKDEQFDKVVSMASSFLMGPVASFLSPAEGNSANPFSKKDIYIFVKKKFIELSKNSTLIILIDDLQWIDSASKELLNYLMSEFSKGSDYKILFIFTVRATEEGTKALKELQLTDDAHAIGFIEKNEQRILLENSFCLSPKSSKWIVDWSSEQNSDRIYPYILVDAVGNLYRTNALEIKENRFSIKDDFDFENPPIPDGPRKEVESFMSSHPEYMELLSLASIYGKEFNVSYMSEALGISYLECVRSLDEISVEGGLLFDVLDKDDIYQFRSQMILDAVRAYIGYSNEGIQSVHVPQAIRHFHALAASAIEQSLQEHTSSTLIMEIANHYYAAGKLYANKAVEYTLKAADACRKMFQYDDALRYLDRTDEILMLTHSQSEESATLRLLIECDKSNVQGVDANKVAEKVLSYIEKNPQTNDELKFAATRACYDAALQNNYDQTWFVKSAQVAKEHLLSSDSELMQAEGHHFMAICMKPQTEDERKEQKEHFNKAILLTKNKYPDAYAKIANSLAEALSYGSAEDKKKAKELFLDSLHIKENAEIKDLPGIARTYGGLGRLAFFSSPPNIDEAKEYFHKDLEIAKEINDQRGISQMNSFLGSCYKAEAAYEDAIVYYNESIEMKNNPFDIHASYDGKLYVLDKLNNEQLVVDTVGLYLNVLEKYGNPAGFIAESIINTLVKYDNEVCKKVVESLKSND